MEERMGTWGTTLYSNDSTCDVRDTYMDFLREQIGNEEAYEKTIEKCKDYIGDQDEPLLWFALADTQWKVGRLMPEVRAKALEWIERDGGAELWEESKNGSAGWKKTLGKLREKLDSDMPKEKRIRKPVVIDQNLWNVNDVYAYHFHTEKAEEFGVKGKYMLIQKIGEGQLDGNGTVRMRIHIFDRLFDGLPTLEDMEGVRILPTDFPTCTHNLCMNRLMIIWKNKREYPAEHLTYIGNIPAPQNKVIEGHRNSFKAWQGIESAGRFFRIWSGVEYETISEGFFRYVHPD